VSRGRRRITDMVAKRTVLKNMGGIPWGLLEIFGKVE
jgi:hypothetical protein